MSDKLEITLRITLDRSGASPRLKRDVDPFFLLGMVNAQLTDAFGDDACLVEMESATGVSRQLIESVRALPRRLKRVLEQLDRDGEAEVTDPDVATALRALGGVRVTGQAGRWLAVRARTPGVTCATPGSSSIKH